MPPSIDAKIEKVLAKRASLDAQIAELGKQKKQQERAQRHKKYTAIGRALLEQVEAGHDIPALKSYDNLLELLDKILVLKSERVLFNLADEEQPEKKPKNKAVKQRVKGAKIQPDSVPSQQSSEQKTTNQKRKQLPTSKDQEELLREFNV